MPFPNLAPISVFTKPPLPPRPKHKPQKSTSSISESFGVPSPDDPDPFGVLALQQAGLQIKEAGTKEEAPLQDFDYKPSPNSPVFRHSAQSFSSNVSIAQALREKVDRDSRRNSTKSYASIDHGTQTAGLVGMPSPLVEQPPQVYESPISRSSDGFSRPQSGPQSQASQPRASLSSHTRSSVVEDERPKGHEEGTQTGPVRAHETFALAKAVLTPVQSPLREEFKPESIPLPGSGSSDDSTGDGEGDIDFDDVDLDDLGDDCEVEIVEATSVVPAVPTAKITPVATKAKVVAIGKRVPPKIPMRNPMRERRRRHTLKSPVILPQQDDFTDDSSVYSSSPTSSPTKSTFEKSDVETNPWSESTSSRGTEPEDLKEEGHWSPQLHASSPEAEQVHVERHNSAEPIEIQSPKPRHSHTQSTAESLQDNVMNRLRSNSTESQATTEVGSIEPPRSNSYKKHDEILISGHPSSASLSTKDNDSFHSITDSPKDTPVQVRPPGNWI